MGLLNIILVYSVFFFLYKWFPHCVVVRLRATRWRLTSCGGNVTVALDQWRPSISLRQSWPLVTQCRHLVFASGDRVPCYQQLVSLQLTALRRHTSTYIQGHAHTYMHTSTCTHVHAHKHIYAHKNMHTSTCTQVHAHNYMHTITQLHTGACTQAHKYKGIHTRTFTQIHACTCPQVHAHKYMQTITQLHSHRCMHRNT